MRSFIGNLGFVLWLDDGSRMSGEVHVRFCEGLGLKCPGLLTPTSAPVRAGYTLPSSSTSLLGRSWAMPLKIIGDLNSHLQRFRWHGLAAKRGLNLFTIAIEAANMRLTIIAVH